MSLNSIHKLGHQPMPAQRERRIADQIAEVLLRHKIDRVFGIPGGTISPVYDALFGAGIELVSCQHETMAVYAAAGYARATGGPAVVAVTSGPGALNALTGLAAACGDELPVLILSGETDIRNFGRAPLQDGSAAGLDLMSMVRPITKFAELALRPERAPLVIDQALAAVNQAPFGTAFVSLPVNLTQVMTQPARMPAMITRGLDPDRATCRRIASMLANASRPAIMLGVGAKRAGIGQLILEIAESMRIPVFTDLEGKGVFPESHPLALGVFGVGARGCAHAYLAEPVDLMLTIGCRFDDTSTAGYAEVLRPDNGILIQLDHDPERLGRAYAPDVAMCADLGLSVQLIQELLPTLPPQTLLHRDRMVREYRSRVPEIEVRTDSRAPHDPRLIAPLVQDIIGPDAVFSCDIGNHMLFTAQNLAIDQPEGFWVSQGLGGMGSGLGTAIGMQLAYGYLRQVVCMIGDGGLLMSGSELSTLARYQIPLITVVFDDRRWGMVEDGFQALYGRASPDFQSPNIDFVNYARAMGLAAVRIESLTQVRDAIEAHRGQPLLLDVPINPNIKPVNPRVDVLGGED
ncbi:thiamine pyrophosphate-binding protein [Pseudenhygromyxa sp. WMMC2535]|uniref:thiamine pyrophosphate-binding protein n=1 Tax=Pseudenhygromyxa sp. WMMC2535 TaxID=2712867 RepID=UPI001554C540|nr:thiamine pyrophosphate-binding protein [Pseudenhygromyxa sp. WMMC2535]NVB38675.1 thiamine pyrophosphate-binding protein [Pseudenhygromyxa sp. WMMC2535]